MHPANYQEAVKEDMKIFPTHRFWRLVRTWYNHRSEILVQGQTMSLEAEDMQRLMSELTEVSQ